MKSGTKEYYQDYYVKNRERIRGRIKKSYGENPERFYKVNKKSLLKNKYNLTLEEYQQMFENQNGVCFICKGKEEGKLLCVDHDHKTGKVRGLLCGSCNRALGLFKDDPELLQIAKEYVSSSTQS